MVTDAHARGGRRITFTIGHDPALAPAAESDGTVTRTGAVCLACQGAVPLTYVRAEGKAKRLGATLMTVVAEGVRQRIYLPPTQAHRDAADVPAPVDLPPGDLGYDPRAITAPNYGMTKFTDLFTHRQLVALTTFTDLVPQARQRVLADALSGGQPAGERLDAGGTDAAAYADAVATYLAFTLSRLSSTNSALCRWNSAPSKESVSDTFSRQALPMVWDFAEGNPWCPGPCDFVWSAGWVAKALTHLPASGQRGIVDHSDARLVAVAGLVSTDPPYYDNIGYADLSDFFYVWQRRAMNGLHPGILGTVLAPKAAELVANPFRHGGSAGANDYFESCLLYTSPSPRD